ncbi:thiamine pyrophosphokinase 1 [Holothuria leucospilota]|uniref:Thiamine pyrophosphokinase n=1 Tax=Holothuria leucospilota TaxID=206669 RepID=A0A9Q1BZR1_HOLLE|nr:thiamine pyrophosphokinase 1 [Holothuria leucospilota]
MNSCNGSVQRLQPLNCLKSKTDCTFPLIVLNRPLAHQCSHLKHLWGNAIFKAGTDGANNELFDFMKRENNYSFIPDLVTGDFDSIRPEVKSFMKTKGVQVIKTPDQNDTDFTKCLVMVIDIMKQKQIQVDCLIAFCSFGGRLDHTLSNINTLFKAHKLVEYPVYLIGDHNLSFLLMPGYHVLDVTTGLEEGTCGLIPVGGKCNSITTTGLKWNLNKDQMEFGGLISSCNKIEVGAKEVTVETDSPVLWTMSLKEKRF